MDMQDTWDVSCRKLLSRYPSQSPERIYHLCSLVTCICQIYKGKKHELSLKSAILSFYSKTAWSCSPLWLVTLEQQERILAIHLQSQFGMYSVSISGKYISLIDNHIHLVKWLLRNPELEWLLRICLPVTVLFSWALTFELQSQKYGHMRVPLKPLETECNNHRERAFYGVQT